MDHLITAVYLEQNNLRANHLESCRELCDETKLSKQTAGKPFKRAEPMAKKKLFNQHAHPDLNSVCEAELQPELEEQRLVSRRYGRKFSAKQITRRRSPRKRRFIRDLMLADDLASECQSSNSK